MVGNDRELQVRVATREDVIEPVCGDRTRAKRHLLSRTIGKPIRSAASPYRDPAVAEVYRRVAVPTHFVRPHCHDYSSALADMMRVCQPGGRIGISAWGSMPNEASRLWKQIVDMFVDADQLREHFQTMVPWEEWFYEPRNLERALAEAG